jgi:Spx/MgsR family transcriptional regulator
MIVYGIPNCDTIKKARKWLQAHELDYQFHDYRKDGLDPTLLKKWSATVGWETLLNKRGTTWRQLPEDTRESINENAAIKIMLEHPAIIKRPVLVQGKTIIVGFNEAEYQKLL